MTGVSYQVNGITYFREVCFSSRPGHRRPITADRPGSISMNANLRGVRNQSHSNYAGLFPWMHMVAMV